MGWADDAKKRLRAGETVEIRPRGNSMVPLVRSGERVVLSPVTEADVLRKGDIVLVRVKGTDYLHLIKAVRAGDRYQIGNNRGGINGWAGRGAIYGRAVRIGEAP